MFTGEPLPDAPMTMNAYLGARPIAAALGGRCGHRRHRAAASTRPSCSGR